MRHSALMLAIAVLLGVVSAAASAQDTGEQAAEKVTKPEYTIDLPAGWSEESFIDGAKIKRTEYVYGDRSQGLLKVKRIRAERGQTLEDVAGRDVDGTLKFLPGYVPGRAERFGGGSLQGQFVQFDFTRGGRQLLGRHYYLAGSDGAVWVLQYTGDRSILGQLRNVTDQMARSFRE